MLRAAPSLCRHGIRAFSSSGRVYTGLDKRPYADHGGILTPGLYDDVVKSFSFPQPETFNIGVEIADKHAARDKDVALIYEDDNTTQMATFGHVVSSSNRLSRALLESFGLQRGDRVAILMSQAVETAVAHASVYKAGLIAVPLFVLFGPEALQYRLNDSGASVLIVEPSKLAEIEELLPHLPNLRHIIVAAPNTSFNLNTGQSPVTATPKTVGKVHIHLLQDVLASHSDETFKLPGPPTTLKDPALVIYTSGTTGNPKGALHSHGVLLGHLPGVEFPQAFFPQPDDLFWTPADWAWIGGLLDVLLPSLYHGTPVLARRFSKFTPQGAFDLIARHKVANMFMPPTALKMMCTVPQSELVDYKHHVRSIGSGGEALGEELLTWGQETFGVTINEFYGQTECNLVIGNCSASFPPKPGSMGRAMPGHTVSIVNNEGEPVADGQVGNIAVKRGHPVMFLEYWNNPTATKNKFVGDWLLTGDMGKRDTEGYFSFYGRDDDVITSAGYRIGPAEIEACLLLHPAVHQCGVIGAPDKLRTEIVKAYIVLAPGQEESDELTASLQEHVKARLAKYEYPRALEFLSELPMTTTGKIIRGDLRKMHAEKHQNQ